MKNTKGYKIFNFVMKIISWCIMTILILIGLFLITYIAINKYYQAKGENSPIGLYTIISGSMTPNINVYDVVFVLKKDPEDIQKGDIVSYYSEKTQIFGTTPVTHRVVEKFNTNNGITFRTKGDANPTVDNEIIKSDRVIGTVRFIIPGLGRLQFFLASKAGWLIVILIPALGIIIYDIIKLLKLIQVKNKMQEVNEITNEEIKEEQPSEDKKELKEKNETQE